MTAAAPSRRSRPSRRSHHPSRRRSQSRRRTARGGAPLPVLTERDFQSKNGFLTSVWGPSLWFVLHMISLNYSTHPTATQRREYQKFFNSLQHVLPCGICRDNLHSNLKCTNYGPHVFKNRNTLSRFVHRLHNCVNGMLGKDKCKMSYKDMRNMYENFRARCSLQTSSEVMPSEDRKDKKEGGCTVPVTGLKSKCTLRIVPINCGSKPMEIDERCLLRRCDNTPLMRCLSKRPRTCKKKGSSSRRN